MIFADYVRGNSESSQYKLACCDGLAMDLLTSVSRELKFEIDLFLVPDGYFGELSVSTFPIIDQMKNFLTNKKLRVFFFTR